MGEFYLVLLSLLLGYVSGYKKPSVYNQTNPSAKFDNPNFIRDRSKYEIMKPEMSDLFKELHRKPFNPGWMDYCDPYHCNDYHKTACGFNRATRRFRWFQSGCHVILNNECATYRGSLRYDVVDPKFCRVYVMNLRTSCPSVCHEGTPTCAIGSRNDVVLFPSRCAIDLVNCRKAIQEYDEVDMSVCNYYLLQGLKRIL